MPWAEDGLSLAIAQHHAPGYEETWQAHVIQQFPFKCSDGKNDNFSINRALISGIQLCAEGKGTS